VDAIPFILGILIGMVSGLIPGLHSNTAIAVLSTLGIPDEAMGAIIVALFSSHLVVSFVPSIFFGIPNDPSIVSVLPGQRMVKEGRGITALKIVLVSILISTMVCVVAFSSSLTIFPVIYATIKPFVGYILIAFSGVLIWKSKNWFLTLGIFLLSGILGTFTMNVKMYDVFLPLFGGFYAMGSIITYQKGAKIPKQKDEPLDSSIMKYIAIGILLGFFADLLPGIGAPSQIATFATFIIPLNTPGYLASIAAISTSESIFSFSTSASIDKSRMGATAWLSSYVSIGDNLVYVLVLFLLSVTISGAIVFFARNWIGKLATLDFSKINILIALYLIAIIFVLDGIEGLAILAVSSCLGYATIRLGVSRTTLMGAIIVPTILLLFRIFIL